MTTQAKRRVGTAIALTSLLVALAVCGIWWRSLFAADVVQHLQAISINNQYARRNWEFLSGGGFFEVGHTTDMPISPARAIQVRALDEKTGYGWSSALPLESVEGSRWEIFCAGLTRLSFYSVHENHSWLVTSGRYLEVPYAIPFLAFLIAPTTAIIRRRLRIRRDTRRLAMVA